MNQWVENSSAVREGLRFRRPWSIDLMSILRRTSWRLYEILKKRGEEICAGIFRSVRCEGLN